MTSPSPAPAFDNSYARLPERFYARLDPTPAPAPRLLRINEGLAEALGLSPAWLRSADGIAALSGARAPEGAEPLAMAYAGHQFGGWSPQLGDGRAILLGEVVGRDGARRDIQLKGSGRTPWSRGGDGRAPLGPVLREYIVSEAMHALGVPTTRSLAAVATGEAVFRETALPGGVLTRVAASHIRVGTFQYFAAREDLEALRLLAEHCIARHYPEAAEAETPPLALFEGVVARQAELAATWMSFGFVHGVMNTDNMTISGETIDYGPCAFLDEYDPDKVFSSIDHYGRYAYAAQPGIAHWNLAALAQSLLPILGTDEKTALAAAQGAVDQFPELFEAAWMARFRAKLGLATAQDGDRPLARSLLGLMAEAEADFTRTFRGLSGAWSAAHDLGARRLEARAEFAAPDGFDRWAEGWRARLAAEGRSPETVLAALDQANPALIPRNHRVEAAIAAGYSGDLSPFERLVSALQTPFDAAGEALDLAEAPQLEERVTRTFCGT